MKASINGATQTRFSRLLGVGTYRPERVVPNSHIAANTGLDEDWIVQRSGIRNRRYAGDAEPLPFMAASAAESALKAAGVEAGQISCVIVATITHLEQMPGLAVEVAHRLGARTAAAFDVSAACAGFCHALGLASDLVQLGQAEHVLVIGAERMTDILDHHDRDTAFLFADGAGAVVVGPSDTPGISPLVFRADGSRNAALKMTSPWNHLEVEKPTPPPVITMSGWKVFRWATNELVPAAERIFETSGVGAEQVDVFLPHQANMLITDHLVDALGLRPDVVVGRDIVDAGNTSAASIPLAMEQLLLSGQASTGDTALLLGFGAGLVYGGQIVHLP